eukprot:COSAG02_NODE_1797_length_10902_cov_25.030177_5_plen_120_part_00
MCVCVCVCTRKREGGCDCRHLTPPVSPLDAIQDEYLKLPLVARVALEAAQSFDNDGKLTEAYVQVRSRYLHQPVPLSTWPLVALRSIASDTMHGLRGGMTTTAVLEGAARLRTMAAGEP